MAKTKSVEAIEILKSSPLKRLIALNKIEKDDELREGINGLLIDILRFSETKIVRSAGGINSMDAMIDASINQSFNRGKISTSVLVRSVMKNAASELEKRENKKRE